MFLLCSMLRAFDFQGVRIMTTRRENGQLKFPFTEPEPPINRLFLGLLLDKDTASDVDRVSERLRAENDIACSRLRRDRLHLSLHSVGEFLRFHKEAAREACRAVEMVAATQFQMCFDRAMTFSGRVDHRPTVLLGSNSALLELRRSIGKALVRGGIRIGMSFNPHVTLFYGPKAVPTQSIERIPFSVREFSLIWSELGRTRYHVLGSWPLKG